MPSRLGTARSFNAGPDRGFTLRVSSGVKLGERGETGGNAVGNRTAGGARSHASLLHNPRMLTVTVFLSSPSRLGTPLPPSLKRADAHGLA